MRVVGGQAAGPPPKSPLPVAAAARVRISPSFCARRTERAGGNEYAARARAWGERQRLAYNHGNADGGDGRCGGIFLPLVFVGDVAGWEHRAEGGGEEEVAQEVFKLLGTWQAPRCERATRHDRIPEETYSGGAAPADDTPHTARC